jgi:hypothetical protein
MKISKRQKFIISSIALSLGFLGINFLTGSLRLWAIGGLGLLTIAFFAWSLLEALAFNATLVNLILPALFTVGVGLFWFLLPTTLFARIPIVVLYVPAIYALISTTNIFAVSTIRTIALNRAAKGVGFVLTLLTSFLLYDTILSLKSQIYWSILAVFLVSFPLFLQGFWTSRVSTRLEREVILIALVSSLGVAQISLLLYFWPVTVVVGSLFYTVGVYVLLGLGQAHLEGRLFKRTLREYLTVGVLVFISMLIATRWRG